MHRNIQNWQRFFYKFPLSSTVLLLPLPNRTVARKFSTGGSTSVQGAWHSEIWLNFTDLQCFIIQFGGLGAFFGELNPQKVLRGDGTAPLPLLRRPWICTLCQETSPKRWFANVNMTSYCDVTNIVYLVTMTTIRHCWILEFGRGHPIKQSSQASPDLCTPLVRSPENSINNVIFVIVIESVAGVAEKRIPMELEPERSLVLRQFSI